MIYKWSGSVILFFHFHSRLRALNTKPHVFHFVLSHWKHLRFEHQHALVEPYNMYIDDNFKSKWNIWLTWASACGKRGHNFKWIDYQSRAKFCQSADSTEYCIYWRAHDVSKLSFDSSFQSHFVCSYSLGCHLKWQINY